MFFFNGLLERYSRRFEQLVRVMITLLEFQYFGEIRTQFFISIKRFNVLKKTHTRRCLGPVVTNYEESMPGFRTIIRIARRRATLL